MESAITRTQSDQGDSRQGRRAYYVALFAVLLIAAVVRCVNYDYDVGRLFTYDTEDKIRQALHVADGNWLPRNWKQPYFLPYSGGLLLRFTGLFTAVDFDTAERVLTLYMIALSLGTLLLVERIGRASFPKTTIGLWSAALLAVVPINVVGSRYIKEDMPVLFWSHVALLCMVHQIRRGTWLLYAASGVATGIAIGSKYSAILLLPLLAASHCFYVWRLRHVSRLHILRQLFSPRALLSVLCVAIGLLLVNPFALTHLREFSDGFLFQVGYSGGAHHDGTRVSPWSHYWTFYLRRALLPGLTVPVLIMASTGLIQLLGRVRYARHAPRTLLAIWVVLAYIVFERATAKPFPFFARYVQPIVPALCVLAAYGGQLWIQALKTRITPGWTRAAAGAIVAISIIPALAQSTSVSLALEPDTRSQASEWLEHNLPAGARIALDDPRYSPVLDKRRFRPRYFGLVSKRLYDTPLGDLRRGGYRYIVLNSFRTERFRVSRGGSESAERAARYYDAVRSLPLVRIFKPRYGHQSYGFHNPIIEVYELTP